MAIAHQLVMITMMLPPVTFLVAFPVARAYDWRLTPSPRQCDNVNIRVEGSDARAPFRALIVPYGPLPLTNAAKRIYEVPFNGKDQYTIDFQVGYPEGTQFIDMVIGAMGFKPSGYPEGHTVLSSSTGDRSCLDGSPRTLAFSFYLYPQLSECEETRIFWTPSDVHGIPFFFAVIPGQGWFTIPIGSIDDRPGFGRGFTWRPPIPAGSTAAIIAGDLRGNASGGHVAMVVQYGTTSLNATSGECPLASATGTISYPLVMETVPYTGQKTVLNLGTAVGLAIGLVIGLILLVIVWLITRFRRRDLAQRNAVPIPVVTEDQQMERKVQERIPSAGSGARTMFHDLPEVMSSPGPTMRNVPNMSQNVWPPDHNRSLSSDKSTSVAFGPSTDGPILLQVD